MKERPILFKGAMVRAILDGSKTQTRRIVKGATGPFWSHPGYRVVMRDGVTKWETHGGKPNDYGPAIKCPQGLPGDRLWVKETHAYFDADPEHAGVVYRESDNGRTWEAQDEGWKWKPSLFMPRWASRITLEVESVRVERLNDCSRGDAMAEGCPFPNMADGPDPRKWYSELWESINGPGSWARNEWVWVVEFRKINTP